MKKFFAYLIFGWFFWMQSPEGSVPGAMVTTLVGPFPSEEVCKAKHDDLKDMLESFGVDIKMRPCAFVQES